MHFTCITDTRKIQLEFDAFIDIIIKNSSIDAALSGRLARQDGLLLTLLFPGFEELESGVPYPPFVPLLFLPIPALF